MTAEIDRLLDVAGASQTEFATVIGVDSSSISRKIAGSRPWKQTEIDALLIFLSKRLGRPVTYEELFGAPEAPGPAEAEPAGGAR